MDRPGERQSAPCRPVRRQAQIPFRRSKTGTIGVELELVVVEAATLQPVPRAPELIESLAADPRVGAKAKPEFLSNTLEINTGVCASVREAIADLGGTIAVATDHAAKRGLRLLSAGTHPYIDPAAQRITEGDRYQQLLDEFQEVGREMVTCGLHVHIGVDSADAAVRATRLLSFALPVFLALSASSPYWKNHDTGLESERCIVFGALPHTGIPPQSPTWRSYVDDYEALRAAGAIESVQSLHYDVRPVSKFGTVELRICDAVPTLREIGAIVALCQCLVAADPPFKYPTLPPTTLENNKWRAVRHGVDARMTVCADGTAEPIGTVIERWVRDLMPTARRLGCAEELADVLSIVELGSSARRQRAVYASSPRRGRRVRTTTGAVVDAGLIDVARALISELEDNRVRFAPDVPGRGVRGVA